MAGVTDAIWPSSHMSDIYVVLTGTSLAPLLPFKTQLTPRVAATHTMNAAAIASTPIDVKMSAKPVGAAPHPAPSRIDTEEKRASAGTRTSSVSCYARRVATPPPEKAKGVGGQGSQR